HSENRAERPAEGGALLRLRQGPGSGRAGGSGHRQAQHRQISERKGGRRMNPQLTLAAAAAITVFHIWASRRMPRYRYLALVVPALWFVVLVFRLATGMLRPAEDWKMPLFPTAILLLNWLEGHQAAKKKELERMRAKDL